MEIPRHWRLRSQRYRLEGSACSACGQGSFPPRRVCPHCKAQSLRTAVPPELLTSTTLIDVELDIRYQIIERMTG